MTAVASSASASASVASLNEEDEVPEEDIKLEAGRLRAAVQEGVERRDELQQRNLKYVWRLCV